MKKIIVAVSGFLLTGSLMAQTGIKPSANKATTAKSATAKPAPAKPTVLAASILKTNKDSASYSLGVRIAQNVKDQGFDKLDPALIEKGISDVFNGKALAIVDTYLDKCIGEFQQKASAEKAAKGKLEGQKFLAENAKRKTVVTTKTGLQYEVIKNGTDSVKPTLNDKVKCHYHGTLINGKVFDSSVDRGEPISFAVSGVIPGWTEALQLMTVGSKWKLFIPSELAYGDRQMGASIPAGSTLIFEVEILAIEK